MPVVKVRPTRSRRTPFSLEDEEARTPTEELEVAADTAELLVGMGAELELDPESLTKKAKLLKEAIKNQKVSKITDLNTAFAAKAFLETYGANLALDVAAIRAACTNKLMEIANCGDTKYELRAIELLGKHSDIGLFTERSEITITHRSPEALEDAIKERIKRLLNADMVDVTPVGENLEAELGSFSLEDLNDLGPDQKDLKVPTEAISDPKNDQKG